jgi:dolichol-phosphate mannosyltransferase
MTRGDVRVWVVLPAYNEAANLPELLDGCCVLRDDADRLDLHLLVVDDGSTDGTAEAARGYAGRLPIEVIANVTNHGLAETFKRGMTEAARRAEAADVIVCMDADASHLPATIVPMIEKIQEGRDVVIASRYRPGAVVRGVPWHRRMASRGMSILCRLVFPIAGVRDYSCGYRAYRAEFLKNALAAQGERLFVMEGFACMLGVLLHLVRAGADVDEVPLVLRYDRKRGPSKMRVGQTLVRTLGVLASARFGRS